MNNTINEMIEKVKLSERQANIQRKSLAQIEEEISRVQKDTKRLKEKTQELNSSYEKKLEELSSKETDLKLAEQWENILKSILAEKKANLQHEETALETVQQSIWKDRDTFCHDVRKFTEDYGILAFMRRVDESRHNKEPIKKEEEHLYEDPELTQLEEEVEVLKAELEREENVHQELKMQLHSAEQEHKRLLNEPSTGIEFKQLQESLRWSKEETEAIEAQCETLQADTFRVEQMLQQNMMLCRNKHLDQNPSPAQTQKQMRNSTLDSWLRSAVRNVDTAVVYKQEEPLVISTDNPSCFNREATQLAVPASTSSQKGDMVPALKSSLENKPPCRMFTPKRPSAVTMHLQNKKRLSMIIQENQEE